MQLFCFFKIHNWGLISWTEATSSCHLCRVVFGSTSSISVFTPAQTYCKKGGNYAEFKPVGLNKASVKTPLSPYCDSKVSWDQLPNPWGKENITDEILNTPPAATRRRLKQTLTSFTVVSPWSRTNLCSACRAVTTSAQQAPCLFLETVSDPRGVLDWPLAFAALDLRPFQCPPLKQLLFKNWDRYTDRFFWTSPTQYQMFCSSRSKTSWEVSLSLKNWCGSMLAGTRIAGYLSFTQRCHPVCHCEVPVTLWGREITQIWSLRPDSLKDCKMAANQRLSSARSQSPRKGWCAPRAATPAKRRLSALSVCPHLKEVFCKHLEEKQPIFM